MWEQVLSKLLYLKAQSCEITFKKPRSVAVEIWQWVICIGTSCSTGLLLATIFWKPDLWRLQQTDRFLQCLSKCLLVLSDASRVDSSFIAFVKFQSVAPCSFEVFQGFEPILECSGTASLKVVNFKYCSASDARMGAACRLCPLHIRLESTSTWNNLHSIEWRVSVPPNTMVA